jgi:hypothetical protein
VLKPLGFVTADPAESANPSNHHDEFEQDYGDQMNIIDKRRQRRGHAILESTDPHHRFHHYVDESTASKYDPVEYSPKREIESNGAKVTALLTIDGVDYVLKQYVDDPTLYEKIRKSIGVPPKAAVDQWPEEVQIFDVDGKGGYRTYYRADVIFIDEAGVKQDHRLK